VYLMMQVRAFASHNVSTLPDLTSCSSAEADGLDMSRLLAHHSIPAGSRGSYAYAFASTAAMSDVSFAVFADIHAT
jgi:hypothetical protein